MKKTINHSARDTMILKRNVKMVVGGIVRRGYSDVVFFFCSENRTSWTRGYHFWFILPSDLSVSRLGKVFLRSDTKIANTPLKLAKNDIVYFKLSFRLPLSLNRIVVPLLWVLVLSTTHSESGFWYPIGQLLFPVPHLSTFVFHTPPIETRFSYPYALFSFSIPLSWNLVFWTLCVKFVLSSPDLYQPN